VPEYLPNYSSESLRRFMDEWNEDSHLLHLCMRGIRVLSGMPNIFSALIETDPEPQNQEQKEKLKKNLIEAKLEAEMAENEEKRDYPLLHAHTLVACWASFEAAIEDTVVKVLLNEPHCLKNKTFARTRISLAEFQAADDEGRIRYLLAEICRSPGRKQGIDFFETQLACVDLTGPVDEDVKKSIWEMHHIRNVIVHRASCVDSKLVEACPWLDLKIGQKLSVSHKMVGVYGRALCDYTLTIAHRLGKRYGVDIETRIRQATEERDKRQSLPLVSEPQSPTTVN
jgi:hypothetical protein